MYSNLHNPQTIARIADAFCCGGTLYPLSALKLAQPRPTGTPSPMGVGADRSEQR